MSTPLAARKLPATVIPPRIFPRLHVVEPPVVEPAPALASPKVFSAEEVAFLAAESAKLETSTPQEIIAWAVEHYFPKLTMATAFGPEGCAILHMLAEVEPRVHVFNLDTGYQFRETLELRERIAERYGIHVEMKQPELTVAEYEAKHGGPLYKTNPDQCCFDRKVSVLKRRPKAGTPG